MKQYIMAVKSCKFDIIVNYRLVTFWFILTSQNL